MLQWIGGCIYIYFELVFLFSFNKYHKENCKKKKKAKIDQQIVVTKGEVQNKRGLRGTNNHV